MNACHSRDLSADKEEAAVVLMSDEHTIAANAIDIKLCLWRIVYNPNYPIGLLMAVSHHLYPLVSIYKSACKLTKNRFGFLNIVIQSVTLLLDIIEISNIKNVRVSLKTIKKDITRAKIIKRICLICSMLLIIRCGSRCSRPIFTLH
jgi:hypothetical protein